eukprot:scaffold235653_cov16-Tisochrysis_lutea.AAC.2
MPASNTSCIPSECFMCTSTSQFQPCITYPFKDKAVAEVEAVLKGHRPEAADTRLLPYIEAVVLESLRLYSPAYM